MILTEFTSRARSVMSGLLMLFGVLPHARAQMTTKDDTAPVQAERPGSETVKTDPKTGDTLVEQHGVASWYGRAWRGRRTASGSKFDERGMTAAHLWLPFATKARVTNLQNGRSVDVVVTDRGPYHSGRIIDLSAKAAEALGIKECGIAEVILSAQF
ncbi:MAG: septal ring lytic transglycosylase RlpA family protein [Stellaceae bacterium]